MYLTLNALQAAFFYRFYRYHRYQYTVHNIFCTMSRTL
jgi:hypothetical protein